jgi:hypothetical protein
MVEIKTEERPVADETRRPPPEPAPVLSPEEARQGVTSGRVTMVLVVSVTLALVVLVAVYVAFV